MTYLKREDIKTATEPGRWQISAEFLDDILNRLPNMDRLMVVVAAFDTVHERIGVVESVSVDDGSIRLTGKNHNAKIDANRIAGIFFDTTSQMKDKTLPKLDFRNASDETIFAMVGLEGLEPFAQAMDPLAKTSVPTLPKPSRENISNEEIDEDDPGNRFLQKLCDEKKSLTIEIAAPGVTQFWQGQIEAVRPMMGHVNIIQPDFHLHLPADKVASWVENKRQWQALDSDGFHIGLTIEVTA